MEWTHKSHILEAQLLDPQTRSLAHSIVDLAPPFAIELPRTQTRTTTSNNTQHSASMKPGEKPTETLYPSLGEPSAPPLAYVPQHEMQEREHVPLARPVFSETAHIGPTAGAEPKPSFLRTTLKLLVFHALNSSLGTIGFVTVVVGAAFSAVLLPLCCLGVVVFRVVLTLVGFLAELDVGLYNFISPPEEHVYVSIPRRAAVLGISGERLSPHLSSFSPLALLAMLYFGTIKFLLSLLSAITLSFSVSFPLNALSEGELPDGFDGVFGFLAFAFLSVVFLLIGVSLMHGVASLSRRATRYFCCEKFSTYRYVHAEHAYPAAATTYGATGAFNA